MKYNMNDSRQRICSKIEKIDFSKNFSIVVSIHEYINASTEYFSEFLLEKKKKKKQR